jgi:hypothetical protein
MRAWEVILFLSENLASASILNFTVAVELEKAAFEMHKSLKVKSEKYFEAGLRLGRSWQVGNQAAGKFERKERIIIVLSKVVERLPRRRILLRPGALQDARDISHHRGFSRRTIFK